MTSIAQGAFREFPYLGPNHHIRAPSVWQGDGVARTIRIHSGVTGGPDDALQELITRVFREEGLDE